MKSRLPAVAAETVGTALLVAVVVGSGIAAQQLTHDTALALLCNALATGGGLVALIVTFGGVSAAFNPVVTAMQLFRGEVPWRDAALVVVGQVVGACCGAVVANLMFALPAVTLSQHGRVTAAHLLAEVVATFGLLVVITGAGRVGRIEVVAGAVASYITGAYFFTSSTSFANPAVTIGRALTDSFAGISPASVLPFIGAQIVGAVLAIGLCRVVFERSDEQTNRSVSLHP